MLCRRKGRPAKATPDFAVELMAGRRAWQGKFFLKIPGKNLTNYRDIYRDRV
jgi:hypothetical protein